MTDSVEDRPWLPGSSPEGVVVRLDGAVMWVVLNRPKVSNAIAPDHRDEIVDALLSGSRDAGVRAVVITGSGGSFCSGADLRAAVTDGPTSPGAGRPPGSLTRLVAEGVQRLVGAVLDCEKPVVAAVDGPAVGLGASLALACDLILASEGASFAQSFVKRGLVPDGGATYLLPRLVGSARAKELLFFGDALSAEDALATGLINRVVAHGGLHEEAWAWAHRLADGPTRALALTKRLVDGSFETNRSTAFAAEAASVELNSQAADSREGIAAFIERREPRFHGS